MQRRRSPVQRCADCNRVGVRTRPQVERFKLTEPDRPNAIAADGQRADRITVGRRLRGIEDVEDVTGIERLRFAANRQSSCPDVVIASIERQRAEQSVERPRGTAHVTDRECVVARSTSHHGRHAGIQRPNFKRMPGRAAQSNVE